MSEPRTEYRRWSGVDSAAVEALLDELSESPLPGARYARDVVRLRVRAIEDESWNAALEMVLRGLRSEDDSTQLRAIIASVSASLRKPEQSSAPEEGK